MVRKIPKIKKPPKDVQFSGFDFDANLQQSVSEIVEFIEGSDNQGIDSESVDFNATQASGLISDNVSDALLELKENIGAGGVSSQLPEKITTIELGAFVNELDERISLNPGDEYTYSINLGKLYSEVNIFRLNWVDKQIDLNTPMALFGGASFSKEFSGSIIISHTRGDAIRSFKMMRKESKDGETTDLAYPIFIKQSEAGIILGYGSQLKQVAIDHVAVFGTKFQISDMWLVDDNDVTLLKILVKNTDEFAVIDLYPYTGFSRQLYGYRGQPKWITTTDINSIALCNDQLQLGVWISRDKGINWRNTSFSDGRPIVGFAGVTDNTSNMLLYAINDYSQFFKYDYELDNWGIQRNAGGLGLDFEINQYFRPHGGQPMDITSDMGLFIGFLDYNARIHKSDDEFQSSTEIFSLDDFVDNIHPDKDFRMYKHMNPYVKVIDANNFFASFAYYSQFIGEDMQQHNQMKQVLLKTDDGGDNWTELLSDVPEWKNSIGTVVHVNESDILLAAFTSYVYGDPYQEYSLKFNMSNDSGETWKYEPGEWPTIEIGNFYSSDYNDSFTGASRSGIILIRGSNGDLVTIFRNSTQKPSISRSFDDGLTWQASSTLVAWSDTEIQGGYGWINSPCYGINADETFLAFTDYGVVNNDDTSFLYTGSSINTYTSWEAWGLPQ